MRNVTFPHFYRFCSSPYLSGRPSYPGVCEKLYAHPEGLDPVVDTPMLCTHAKDCHDFVAVEAKAGDSFILHGLLPHTNSYNYKHYPRVITNPHVTLKEPYNLNRGPADGDYVSLFRLIIFSIHFLAALTPQELLINCFSLFWNKSFSGRLAALPCLNITRYAPGCSGTRVTPPSSSTRSTKSWDG